MFRGHLALRSSMTCGTRCSAAAPARCQRRDVTIVANFSTFAARWLEYARPCQTELEVMGLVAWRVGAGKGWLQNRNCGSWSGGRAQYQRDRPLGALCRSGHPAPDSPPRIDASLRAPARPAPTRGGRHGHTPHASGRQALAGRLVGMAATSGAGPNFKSPVTARS
jgi:hypothetical protein